MTPRHRRSTTGSPRWRSSTRFGARRARESRSTSRHDRCPMTGVMVVGTGFGCFTHVRALRNAGFEVRAVVGRDPDKTAARAKAFEVPNALTSLQDALALPEVDAVTVASPPQTHAAIVLDALRA